MNIFVVYLQKCSGEGVHFNHYNIMPCKFQDRLIKHVAIYSYYIIIGTTTKVTGFAKTVPNGTRTEMQFIAEH